MFRIVKKEVLSPKITLLEIEAPYIARKAQPGQFIIFRIDEQGDGFPLTIGGYDREKGTHHHHLPARWSVHYGSGSNGRGRRSAGLGWSSGSAY